MSSTSKQSSESSNIWDSVIALTENMKSASLCCLGSSVVSREAAAVTVCPNKTSYVSNFLTNWDFQPKQFLSDQSWTSCNPQPPNLWGILKLHWARTQFTCLSAQLNLVVLGFFFGNMCIPLWLRTQRFLISLELSWIVVHWCDFCPVFYGQRCVRWDCGVFDSMSLDNDLQANKKACLF